MKHWATLAAKFSIQHIAAATAVYGAAGADSFHADTLGDPGLAGLRGRVTIAPFAPAMDPPNDRPARVVLTLADGRTLGGECPSARGGTDRPFTGAEIEIKAGRILAAAYRGAFAPLAAAVRQEDPVLSRPWRDIVGDFA